LAISICWKTRGTAEKVLIWSVREREKEEEGSKNYLQLYTPGVGQT
jgi:hypothetical protein